MNRASRHIQKGLIQRQRFHQGSVGFKDFTNDGIPDLLSYAINEEPLYYENDGSFNFIRSDIRNLVGEFSNSDLPDMNQKTYRISDFDGNGDLDLLVLPGEWARSEDIDFTASLFL